MTVRAKFYVDSMTYRPGNQGGAEVVLRPVTRGEANKDWSKYTPSGELRMQVLNPAATEWFQNVMWRGQTEGKYPEVYLTFEVAEDD